MTWEAWFTLAVTLTVLFLLVRDVVAPSAAMAGGMAAVLVAGVVTPSEALSGFSNPAPLTVAALYVLARAVEKTGALTPLVRHAMGDGKSIRRSMARMTVPASLASGFVNNTPVVAMLIPEVSSWARRQGKSPSLFLMPLSFAALLGGVITLIGTSTNIVVSSLLVQYGYEPFGFFELGRVGLPIALIGVVLLIVLAPMLLEERRSAREELQRANRPFVVEMVVEQGGALDGTSVEAGGLRQLRSTFLAAIERREEVSSLVGPDTTLHGGDRLRFVGDVGDVVELQNMRGLSSPEQPHVLAMDSDARYFEAVVGDQSSLVGRTLKEVGFRSRYQAVVMAIHRAGQLVDAKLGEVPLRVGDTLLVLADDGFRARWRDRGDFLLISGREGTVPVRRTKSIAVGVVGAGIVILAATGLMPILELSLVGALLLVALGVLTPAEARNAVDLDVVLVIATAFGLAAAMQVSGLAEVVSNLLVGGFGWIGDSGVVLGITLATILLTGLITNNAAALLMFPVALSSSATTGIDPRALAVTVAIAASMDFLTPIGYQTNTMVYGPGGYHFFDYTKLGAPLTLLVIIMILVLVPVSWPLR
ncbi:MAG TPA: SLC13 family permease [Acidimicrobiia bacterium]|nr:SLC13 family permease [Acidimicrobiia bacterium]